jgi:hypothetical protein
MPRLGIWINRDITDNAAAIFHEITHFVSIYGTDDDGYGSIYYNNTYAYEQLESSTFSTWCSILRNGIIAETGANCCPTPAWPNN